MSVQHMPVPLVQHVSQPALSDTLCICIVLLQLQTDYKVKQCNVIKIHSIFYESLEENYVDYPIFYFLLGITV